MKFSIVLTFAMGAFAASVAQKSRDLPGCEDGVEGDSDNWDTDDCGGECYFVENADNDNNGGTCYGRCVNLDPMGRRGLQKRSWTCNGVSEEYLE